MIKYSRIMASILSEGALLEPHATLLLHSGANQHKNWQTSATVKNS